MDLNQRKLNKTEWSSIEVPVSGDEKNVLKMIVMGFNDPNIKQNHTTSVFTYLKIDFSEKMEDYLYNNYLAERCNKLQESIKHIDPLFGFITVNSNIKINSADKIRLERNDEKTLRKQNLYEYLLITYAEKFAHYKMKEITKSHTKQTMLVSQSSMYYYYTLYKLIRNTVVRVNKHVLTICNNIIDLFHNDVSVANIIEYADEYIEKNDTLIKYEDLTLYEHQKEIFSICKNNLKPKLILYMAPTGTGKTLTPLALSETYKIVFVCAARHVGLALARAAISIGKKIAFAFGCDSADDIRLHYFAAKEFTKNKRTGGIGKVDNSVGDDVEIIICDIKSYLPAMYYIREFNKDECGNYRYDNLMIYWDEPTITLDYDDHEFHSIIKKNWSENVIPNMVLSSATLPKTHELTDTISDFQSKFPDATIHSIVSHDCKKSIPIVNKDGYVVVPHYLSSEYIKIVEIAKHCENNLTLLRYFDLKAVADFITFVNQSNFTTSNKMQLARHFESLNEVNMTNIKVYYIKMLQNILQSTWSIIYEHFKITRTLKLQVNNTVDTLGHKINKARSIGPGVILDTNQGKPLSRLISEQLPPQIPSHNGAAGVYITTKDAYSLTDGPTIYITNEIEKIAKFCVQQANIPAVVMEDIMKKIDYNNVLNEQLATLETKLDYIKDQSEQSAKNSVATSHAGVAVNGRNKSSKDIKKLNREPLDDKMVKSSGADMSLLTNEMNSLRTLIKSVVLNDVFVPNKQNHIKKWAENMNTEKSFTSDIDDKTVNDIMLLNGVNNLWKVMLMMGIGVFINHENIKYTEIMKQLADEQKLYMIIASSDYIYGTNYQFCHGYLSKDLNLTQEKIIQAMGRIGRNNIQQSYTIRFRDDLQINKLFTNDTEKPEIINMNKLFNSNMSST
jgi:hypothetical protein